MCSDFPPGVPFQMSGDLPRAFTGSSSFCFAVCPTPQKIGSSKPLPRSYFPPGYPFNRGYIDYSVHPLLVPSLYRVYNSSYFAFAVFVVPFQSLLWVWGCLCKPTVVRACRHQLELPRLYVFPSSAYNVYCRLPRNFCRGS